MGIRGPRGVGKTTLMLQHIKKDLNTGDVLYVNADDIYFSDHRLIDLTENLIYSLAENEVNVGNLRETFFLNQTRVKNPVISSCISDFQIGRRTFEIGGKSKGKKQIEKAEEGYIVKDGIEFSSGNILPLWWFGLNY